MPEIERKLLVDDAAAGPETVLAARAWSRATSRSPTTSRCASGGSTAATARMTVKSAPGLSRVEEELALDGDAFERLWPLTEGRRVVKTRHAREADDGVVLELDVYEGSLSGLATLEVEFASEEAAGAWTPPAWAGREVTGEKAYANQSLALFGAP